MPMRPPFHGGKGRGSGARGNPTFVFSAGTGRRSAVRGRLLRGAYVSAGEACPAAWGSGHVPEYPFRKRAGMYLRAGKAGMEPGEWHLPHRYVPVLCHAHASAFPWQNGQKLRRAGESDICIFGRNGQTFRRAGAAPARGICLRRGGVSRCVGKRTCPGISFSQKGRHVPACGKGGYGAGGVASSSPVCSGVVPCPCVRLSMAERAEAPARGGIRCGRCKRRLLRQEAPARGGIRHLYFRPERADVPPCGGGSCAVHMSPPGRRVPLRGEAGMS